MITEGTLLGGRVRYRQMATGFRTGIEPVLLAASVPARAGDRVLEAGTGAGAALLCLAARVPGIAGLGLERDPALAALARQNLAANRLPGLAIEASDIAAWRADALFDHAMANPPWHDAASTRAADPGRAGAKFGGEGLLHAWTGALARALRARGTLTLILPASRLAEGAAALRAARCGACALLPLWPRAGMRARLVLLQAVRLGRGADRVLPGLTLHPPRSAPGAQGYSPEAASILRDGAALAFNAGRGGGGARAAHARPPGSPASGAGSAPAACHGG